MQQQGEPQNGKKLIDQAQVPSCPDGIGAGPAMGQLAVCGRYDIDRAVPCGLYTIRCHRTECWDSASDLKPVHDVGADNTGCFFALRDVKSADDVSETEQEESTNWWERAKRSLPT